MFVAIMLAVLAFITGCAQPQPIFKEVPASHTTVVVSVPDEMLQFQAATAPPSKESFVPFKPRTDDEVIKLLYIQKQLLLQYTQSLLADIAELQRKLVGVSEYQKNKLESLKHE